MLEELAMSFFRVLHIQVYMASYARRLDSSLIPLKTPNFITALYVSWSVSIICEVEGTWNS